MHTTNTSSTQQAGRRDNHLRSDAVGKAVAEGSGRDTQEGNAIRVGFGHLGSCNADDVFAVLSSPCSQQQIMPSASSLRVSPIHDSHSDSKFTLRRDHRAFEICKKPCAVYSSQTGTGFHITTPGTDDSRQEKLSSYQRKNSHGHNAPRSKFQRRNMPAPDRAWFRQQSTSGPGTLASRRLYSSRGSGSLPLPDLDSTQSSPSRGHNPTCL